ncbi:MAG: hypothetical protein BWY46_01687 [Firmicutes bacterium ADurb.Bin300]|nr:MAG: hypothetical protein BWY46_01687 [Firmicutes bacterium ADurb.Bin300]HOD02069.1 AI-2E family transporter [Clostridiales bacterium]
MGNNKNGKSKILLIFDEFIDAGIGVAKAMLIMFFIDTIIITAGLLLLNLRWWALPIAIGISLIDILPLLGSGIVFIPWIIFSVYNENSQFALGLGIIFILLIVLRMVLQPLITGKKIGLSPLISVAAAVAGIMFFGGIGLIAGPLIAAVGMTAYRIYHSKENN